MELRHRCFRCCLRATSSCGPPAITLPPVAARSDVYRWKQWKEEGGTKEDDEEIRNRGRIGGANV
ncbi:hypothetical protein E2C01_058498 [Portunus trituberculatus]|uniref:Uncharacterized protein n=1 Tax=Portunus trituberculatus TaxID=210409 RepID=A0A5B7H6A6_PORTR|nr:hypothetical protein [Portunus trituberculatus]